MGFNALFTGVDVYAPKTGVTGESMRALAAASALVLAILLGVMAGYIALQEELTPPKQLSADAGLAYLRLEPVKVRDDPVLGNGTILYYVAEVVIVNKEVGDGILLERVQLGIPSEVYVESPDCGGSKMNITVTVVPGVSGPGERAGVSSKCMKPVEGPGKLGNGYLAIGDLLRGEGMRVLSGSMNYYVPPRHELHFIIDGAVFVPESVDDVAQRLARGYVLVVVEVSGKGYGVKGFFHDAVLINATLAEVGGAYYFVGPYSNIIAGSVETSAIFPIKEG